jgi:hypothetical protein
MRRARALAALAILAWPSMVLADDPPVIDHQPVPCTVPDKAISLCAAVSDDAEVAKSRIYFKPAGDEFYSFVDMAFRGLNYCGTVPAPREGGMRVLEYYIQAVDNAYQAQRTSTFQMNVQPEGVCEFPPIEKDRGAAITVYATNKKQGKKLPDEFAASGVTFVPIAK